MTIDDSAWELPPHAVEVFRPRRARYAVIVTVLNEGERLAHQLDRMRPYTEVCDIVIADAPSTDGSTAAARLERSDVHAVVRLTGRGGFSSSLRAGLAYVVRSGVAGAILMNGNDKDHPSALPAFVDHLDEGGDYVQGTRYGPGGHAVNTPLSREILIRWVHAPLFSLIAGRQFTDTTNGFRAFSRRYLVDPRVRPWRRGFDHYELGYYLAWAACRFGFRVEEIPVTRAYPYAGSAPTKIRGVGRHWRLFQPLVMLALRRY